MSGRISVQPWREEPRKGGSHSLGAGGQRLLAFTTQGWAETRDGDAALPHPLPRLCRRFSVEKPVKGKLRPLGHVPYSTLLSAVTCALPPTPPGCSRTRLAQGTQTGRFHIDLKAVRNATRRGGSLGTRLSDTAGLHLGGPGLISAVEYRAQKPLQMTEIRGPSQPGLPVTPCRVLGPGLLRQKKRKQAAGQAPA